MSSEEEEEVEYVSLSDLDIIEDIDNWKPTKDQVKTYAKQLGFDVENDPPEFLKIAYNFLTFPLKKKWVKGFLKNTNQLVYLDTNTNEIHLESDIEELAKESYSTLKEEYKDILRKELEKEFGNINNKDS